MPVSRAGQERLRLCCALASYEFPIRPNESVRANRCSLRFRQAVDTRGGDLSFEESQSLFAPNR